MNRHRHPCFPRLAEISVDYLCRLADAANFNRPPEEFLSLDGEPVCFGSLETGLVVGWKISVVD